MRGGARQNAGRRPLLTVEQRLLLGSDCEKKLQELKDAALQDHIQERLSAGGSEYLHYVESVNAIPVHKRPKRTVDEIEQHEADIEAELLAIAGLSMHSVDPAPRLLIIPYKQPKGVRKQIISAVAADWSHRIGKPISESTVKKCWDEWRAEVAWLRQQLGGTKPF